MCTRFLIYIFFIISLQQIANWLSLTPAKRTKLEHKKGEIRVGNDGDFVIWRPESAYEINVTDIHFKNKLSPYVGETLYGAVDRTIVRGNTVYDRKKTGLFAETPFGNALLQ